MIRIAADPTDRGHFLGSVVYVSTGDSSAGFTRWLLVDGQQRLTTLILLLIALRDHITDTDWKGPEDGPTAKRVEAYFLKNVQEEGERQHKLVLRRHDQEGLQALLDRAIFPDGGSERIRENYEFFQGCIENADPADVYRGIGRLVVVDVTLDRALDDPQLIFESLNSTGMDLSQSDRIRNFILMRLPEKEQTRLYEAYWSKIENLFRGSEKMFDSFIRDFIALRTQASKQEKADEIYFAFCREFGSIGAEPEKLDALLQEMLRLARYHAAFSIGADAPPALKAPLSRLRRQVDVPAILIMKLFDYYETHRILSAEQFAEAIDLIESYVFRRAICGEQTRGYWQIFANLAYRIDPKMPFESLKVGLARLPSTYAFPNNDEFRKALEERDIYHKRVCFDLLDRLENHHSKEITDTSKYSIEHIMPQNDKLSPEWRKMLGEHWQDVQREWLHRLGNLTLTGYNSTYSDQPFDKKKSIPGGFSESSVRLNKFVREQEVWTPPEMDCRGKDLAKRALHVWPKLRVEQELIQKAKEAELRELAQRRDVSKIQMTLAAQRLFEILRERVRAIDANIIELAEQRSVSYHERAFFLEVIPRKNQISLLLPLDYNEIEDPSGIAEDASQWKFFMNAAHEGGVYVRIRKEEDIDKALPMIRLARERATP